jgi:chemotaxis protein methyltransferase CheR
MSVTAEDFAFVQRLVAQESAQTLPAEKEYLVHNRLVVVAQREGLASVGELIAAVRGGERRLRRLLVEALFIHETLFFRDEHPFTALRDVLLPRCLERRGGRRLALWSAATSTGQEAYSLAMLVHEQGWSPAELRLLATDLSEGALQRARAGRYSDLELRRGLPLPLRQRYFVPAGREWQIRDEIRAMVQFAQLNLARPFATVVGELDVVLLRNVLIYLDAATRVALTRRIAEVLAPGGYLLLGGSETIDTGDGLFDVTRVGRTTVYVRSQVGR